MNRYTFANEESRGNFKLKNRDKQVIYRRLNVFFVSVIFRIFEFKQTLITMKAVLRNAGKNLLSYTSTWDKICFPVQTVALEELLPENYNVIATDRQRAIVGQKTDGSNQVFAIQSKSYSLIPNSIIKSVADECLGIDYELNVRYSSQFRLGLYCPIRW